MTTIRDAAALLVLILIAVSIRVDWQKDSDHSDHSDHSDPQEQSAQQTLAPICIAPDLDDPVGSASDCQNRLERDVPLRRSIVTRSSTIG